MGRVLGSRPRVWVRHKEPVWLEPRAVWCPERVGRGVGTLVGKHGPKGFGVGSFKGQGSQRDLSVLPPLMSSGAKIGLGGSLAAG